MISASHVRAKLKKALEERDALDQKIQNLRDELVKSEKKMTDR
jgi:hypothetical protein